MVPGKEESKEKEAKAEGNQPGKNEEEIIEQKKNESGPFYAVVRLRGKSRASRHVLDTLGRLRLARANSCTLVPADKTHLGMLRHAEDFVAWGDISEDLLAEMIANHVLLIAERGAERLGFVGGVLAPQLFNREIYCLQETFWWVTPEARGTSAGLRLLDAFNEAGEKVGVDWIWFSLQHNTPCKDKALIKRGFRLQERMYLREVADGSSDNDSGNRQSCLGGRGCCVLGDGGEIAEEGSPEGAEEGDSEAAEGDPGGGV